ncbi:MAG: exosome complex RNA-binding protein Rrp4 [Nanoarchaeota archaeon]
MTKEKSDRKVVIPGEVIFEGEEYLPGEGTEKRENKIVAIRYGLAEESNGLVKVIAVSGVYQPRRGNVVIGKVENLTFYGWQINIDSAEGAFLPLQEVPGFVSKEELAEVMDIGDMVAAKIIGVSGRGVDLTIKLRGLGRIDEGLIIKVNSNKVPRVIGKEGSMINIIKEESGCNVTVGQNGLIWIKGEKIEEELLVKKAIEFIIERSSSHGLTEEVKEWFDKEKKEMKK